MACPCGVVHNGKILGKFFQLVFITYYTAWVDDAGQLNFREDIYDHDKTLVGRMFSGNTLLARN